VWRAPPVPELAHAHAHALALALALALAPTRCDRWRSMYTLARPQQALGAAVPADRSRPSGRPVPEPLPPIEDAPAELVRQGFAPGRSARPGRQSRLGRAFVGQPVARRPTQATDLDAGSAGSCCHQRGTTLDLRDPAPAS
jgi:hypothetical protein